jgi:hypothetical protein
MKHGITVSEETAPKECCAVSRGVATRASGAFRGQVHMYAVKLVYTALHTPLDFNEAHLLNVRVNRCICVQFVFFSAPCSQ